MAHAVQNGCDPVDVTNEMVAREIAQLYLMAVNMRKDYYRIK